MDKNPPANEGKTGSVPGLWRFHMPQSNYPCTTTTKPARSRARKPYCWTHMLQARARSLCTKKKKRSLCTTAKVLHATNACRNKTQNGQINIKKKKTTLGTDGFVEKSYPTCKDFCFIVNYTSLAPKTMSHMGLCLILFAEWISYIKLYMK